MTVYLELPYKQSEIIAAKTVREDGEAVIHADEKDSLLQCL